MSNPSNPLVRLDVELSPASSPLAHLSSGAQLQSIDERIIAAARELGGFSGAVAAPVDVPRAHGWVTTSRTDLTGEVLIRGRVQAPSRNSNLPITEVYRQTLDHPSDEDLREALAAARDAVREASAQL